MNTPKIAIENGNHISVQEFWKGYNNNSAIENIDLSWEEISFETMNAVWKVLWPEYIKDLKEYEF